MNEIPSFDKPLRAFCAAIALASAAACGAASVDTPLGSETHFLARCSAECGGGLECLDGVCTRSCAEDTECSSLNPAATCEPEGAGGSSCRVACGADDECRTQSSDWTCSNASCVSKPALLSSSGPIGSGRCPTFPGGVQQPLEVETTFERVPGSANVEWAYADESGVYWIDRDGAVFGVKQGATSAVVLRPAPVTGTRLGLMADASQLYWTEASEVPPGPAEPGLPPPPGRLMSVSKDGGPVTILVETPSQVLIPLGVDPTGRVLVTSSDGSVNEVTSSGVLERVANIPLLLGGGVQMADGLVYWSEYEDATELTPLFAAIPGGPAPVRVTSREDSMGFDSFVAGRGVVLWTLGETRFDPLLLVQRFVMLNENTGCVQELPSVELSIGQTLLDTRHVYWHSFNGLGAASPGLPDALAPLLRVDLRTGRFEHVATPGFDITVVTDLVAQDEGTIYVRNNDDRGLLAARKPD